MQHKGVIVIVCVVIIIVGFWHLGNIDSNKSRVANTEDGSQLNEATAVDESGRDNEEVAGGSYETYTPEKLTFASKGDVVLFFKADWCPSCRALDSDIKANLNAIPDGVTILEVDYDSETELKKKYGVTTQHTFVQVDAEGTMIDKWSGSPTLARLVTEIN